jgi:hypothetical protein
MHGEEYETVWGEGEKDDKKKTSWRTKRIRAKKRNKGRKSDEDSAKEYNGNAKEETEWERTTITLLWKRKLSDLVYTPNSNQS